MVTNDKIRKSIYQLGTVLTGLLGLALIWGGLDQGAADHIGLILQGVVALFGSGATGLAAAKTGEQIKDGTLGPRSPLDELLNGAKGLREARDTAVTEFAKAEAELTALRSYGANPIVPSHPADVFAGLVAPLPVVGPLTKQLVSRFR